MRKPIPGLDHCLDESGQWIPTSTYLFRVIDYRDPKRLVTKRKTERKAEQCPGQKSIWEAMADG